MHHLIVLGTRPEIIKTSPLIKLLEKKNEEFTVIYTGQHYDYEMSQIFFKELELPQPDYKLKIPNNSALQQVPFILSNLVNLIEKIKPDICYAQGDTNSVQAAAITSNITRTPFGHIEAGIRSFDHTMPEEINRKIAAVCASLHFCPTEIAAKNLILERVEPNRISVTGNTIVDVINEFILKGKFRKNILKNYIQNPKNEIILLMTLHRPGSVDNKAILKRIILALKKLDAKIIFLAHPRTLKRINEFNLMQIINKSNIILEKPLGYFDFLSLMKECDGVITDSGGIQEEITSMNKFGIILRPNTERPESVLAGIAKLVNPLLSRFEENLIKAFSNFIKKEKKWSVSKNPYGDGKASYRILNRVLESYRNDTLTYKIPKLTNQYPTVKFKEKIEKTDKVLLSFDKNGNIIINNEKNESKYYLTETYFNLQK